MDFVRAKAADAIRATQRANSGQPQPETTPGVTLGCQSFSLKPDDRQRLDENYARTRRVLSEAALLE